MLTSTELATNLNRFGQRMCELQTVVLRGQTLAAYNSTYPKGGGSCSKDSFVVNQTLVFQIKFCGKSPAFG
jgi:hypothetical protein